MGDVLMVIYRACRRNFSPPDSQGAFLNHARWHLAGARVLYCAQSLSLAVLEQCTNGANLKDVREDFHYSSVDVKGLEIEIAPEILFDPDWRDRLLETRNHGMGWIRSGRTPLLKVRSTANSDEWNFVLNTGHPDFKRVIFSDPKPIPLDERL